MRRAVVGFAIASLSFGPWLGTLGALGFSGSPTLLASPASFSWEDSPSAQVAPIDPIRGRRVASSGCICRDVVVNASNIVRDAEIESGDAEVKNSSLTYIAPGFKGEVEVEQVADARSGDAIAGQIIAVDAGEGCARVSVRARNLVEDSEVESGDAVAKNRSVVLFNPSVDREEVELDIEQDAEAVSGVPMAGQVIGVQGGGGPCGGVEVDALNDVIDVDLESGEAITDNDSVIEDCDAVCIEELEEQLEGVDALQVCDEDGCEVVSREEFLEMLGGEPSDAGDEASNPTPAASEDEEGDAATPTPKPSDPDDDDDDDASATPSPTPTPLPEEPKGQRASG
jgi:hypothetical protein